jgi:anti-sigma factor RsiW
MTLMTNTKSPERAPHDEAEELLPWYATGQLEADDRIRVEAHLSACAECREQLALERRLVKEFRAITPEIESGWARLRLRLATPQPVVFQPTRPSALAEFWSLVTRPAVAGLALAQVAFLLVAGGVLISLSQPTYHALGSAPVPASANLIVMFRADTTVGDVQQSLRRAGASIVDGPTEADAYLLHVDPRQRQTALASLKSDGDVQLAEPIDGEKS